MFSLSLERKDRTTFFTEMNKYGFSAAIEGMLVRYGVAWIKMNLCVPLLTCFIARVFHTLKFSFQSFNFF